MINPTHVLHVSNPAMHSKRTHGGGGGCSTGAKGSPGHAEEGGAGGGGGGGKQAVDPEAVLGGGAGGGAQCAVGGAQYDCDAGAAAALAPRQKVYCGKAPYDGHCIPG